MQNNSFYISFLPGTLGHKNYIFLMKFYIYSVPLTLFYGNGGVAGWEAGFNIKKAAKILRAVLPIITTNLYPYNIYWVVIESKAFFLFPSEKFNGREVMQVLRA